MRWVPIDEVVRDIHIRDAREEGMEEGKAEGKAEGKFEVARKMLARKMSVSDIIDITGLNERDIFSIQ
ncbi:hypothetical protein FACS1894204_01770 [Synergistales bacterium]|nr:hypothetical protein FACS1894204_01770 [Synergistales bacterium]